MQSAQAENSRWFGPTDWDVLDRRSVAVTHAVSLGVSGETRAVSALFDGDAT